jgi:2-oxoisovalerate dehydrogenase E2 component (dihydrolipoyl transacylase)
MMNTFNLPDVGEGLTEAEIIRWCVKPGDTVAVNDVLVEIETAKSIVELPSPFAGTVGQVLVAEGDMVEVGTPIITVGDESQSLPEPQPEPQPAREAMLVGYGPAAEQTSRRRKASAPATATQTLVGTRTLAKPPVRKLAKDLGINLADVPSSGPVVTRAEVQEFAQRRSCSQEPRPLVADDDVRIPVKGVRKATAQAMVASAFTAPHVTEWVTVDVTRTVDLVQALKSDRRFDGLKVSPTLIAAKAICLALRRTPELNATFDDAAGEIVLKRRVNLGVAAATDRGLVVPNIAAADQMTLAELSQAITELTATARDGKTQPEQQRGGTFTLTNVGVFGVDGGTPILNPGETGILALGSIARRPWVDEHDNVVPRWVTTLALSFDHRVADGQQGSAFLADVAAILHDPAVGITF